MAGQLFHVLGVITQRQKAAVDLGMQGLDAAVKHFRKSGILGNFLDLDMGRTQKRRRAAGGKNFYAQLLQAFGKIHQTGFVGNRD